MRSQTAKFLFSKGYNVITEMYRIQVVDPGLLVSNGNFGPPDFRLLVEPAPQTQFDWLRLALRTFNKNKGERLDIAALAAYWICSDVYEYETGYSVEVISGLDHPFVVVNRKGSVHDIESWGVNAFIMDPWYQNHFPKDQISGIFWMSADGSSDAYHQIRQDIIVNSHKLEVLGKIALPLDDPYNSGDPLPKRKFH
ncbi:MAG: hypothetical protein KAH18_12025 [Psychromonas sp.]|nr:hypothetical protein [Psychromonas sp.]